MCSMCITEVLNFHDSQDLHTHSSFADFSMDFETPTIKNFETVESSTTAQGDAFYPSPNTMAKKKRIPILNCSKTRKHLLQ